MIARDAERLIRRHLKGFPIVTITGPRQSGKTTLVRAIFPDKPYFSLEDPDIRQLAMDDPRGFLARMPEGAVLDEVQRAPDILSYLQSHVDERGRIGLFLLTGSQHFGLISDITQSLAGRTAFVELLPFSLNELDQAKIRPPDLEEMLFFGGYPPLYDRGLSPGDWMPAYVTAYLERDVRQLLKVQDLDSFQRFLRLCAGRSGQLLNLSSLATDCGITHNTAKSWISVLEASFIVFRLRPHHVNFRKRLVKSPKLYFHDSGLLCWLLGIQNAEQIKTHPLRGAIFETFIVSEIKRSCLNRALNIDLYFWRDSNGREVDLVADSGGRLMPVEIKSGQTVNRNFFQNLEHWMGLAKDAAAFPTLIYGGDWETVRKGVRILGWDKAGLTLDALVKG
jgi:uncharacterized protein